MECDTVIPHYLGDTIFPNPLLFNLEEDISEKHDLSNKYPELVKEMTKKWDDWFKDVMKDYRTSWKKLKKMKEKDGSNQ